MTEPKRLDDTIESIRDGRERSSATSGARSGRIRRSSARLKAGTRSREVAPSGKIQRSGNRSGLPEPIRSRIEDLSGVALDGVRVHYGSHQPAQLGALAYTQGTDIFVAPGQERHLAHEAWHAVQQAQGRVRPSMQLMRLPVNDDAALEREADLMAAQAMTATADAELTAPSRPGRVIARGVVQRMALRDADDAIEREKIDVEWYRRVVVPTLSTIARRAGQTYEQYLAPLGEPAFLQTVRELATTVKQEPVGLFEKFRGILPGSSSKATSKDALSFVDSQVYPKMMRCVGTNLLVLKNMNFDATGAPTPAVVKFAELYQSGKLVWARGVGISHFAWDALRKGVIASEGTADIPTFTMNNPVSTRWLPGVYVPTEARDIGMSVGGEALGLREMMNRKDVPTGATALYTVPPTAPVAYLNDGEQVVRGPLFGSDVSIFCVGVLGPTGPTKHVAPNSRPSDLPPAAPYQAAPGSTAIQDWEHAIDLWFASL